MNFLLLNSSNALNPWQECKKYLYPIAVKMWLYHSLKRNKQISDVVQKRWMEKCCDGSRIMVFFLSQIERSDNSSFLHVVSDRSCPSIGWDEAVQPMGGERETRWGNSAGPGQWFHKIKTQRRKDTSVLRTALHKTDNERRVLELEAVPRSWRGTSVWSWHWAKLPSELPLKLCRRHSITRPGWQVPVVLPVHISDSPETSHFAKISHKAKQGWEHVRFGSAKPN